jgi:hypothetical protein
MSDPRTIVTIEKKNGTQSSLIVRQLPHDPVATVGGRLLGGRIVAVRVLA